MSDCKGCGGAYRKGTIALVFAADGTSSRSRVCPRCAARGLLVVAATVAPVIVKHEVRPESVDKAIRALSVFASTARASARASASSEGGSVTTEAEAYESAIEVLKRFT